MKNSTHPTERKTRNTPLIYAFDGQFIPTLPPDDNSVETIESYNKDSHTGQSSKSRYSGHSWTADLNSSIRIVGESMLKMQMVELEMMKKREMAREDAELQRANVEYEMTQMILQTQLQIASFVSQNCNSRKRKCANTNEGSSPTERYLQ